MKKIVIIDDDFDILWVLKFILSEQGHDVVTSPCPKILHNLNDLKPDLILLDIWLGSGDGSSMCRLLKQSQLTSDIPIVLISAVNNLKQIACTVGADFYIEKPFAIETIESVVSEMAL